MPEHTGLVNTDKWRGVAWWATYPHRSVQVVENKAAGAYEREHGLHMAMLCIVHAGLQLNVDNIVAHSMAAHPHVVPVLDVVQIETPDSTRLGVVLELAERTILELDMQEPPVQPNSNKLPHTSSWHSHPLKEAPARRVLQQTILGVQYCHQIGLAGLHIDTIALPMSPYWRPSQVPPYCRGGAAATFTPRVAFGGVQYHKGSALHVGPTEAEIVDPSYEPPEAHAAGGVCALGFEARKRSDCWRVGVLLCVLLTGELPFAAAADHLGVDDIAVISRRVLQGDKVDVAQAAMEALPSAAQDLLSRLLNRDAEGRCTLQQALEHEWVQQEMPEDMLPWQAQQLAAADAVSASDEGRAVWAAARARVQAIADAVAASRSDAPANA